MVKKWVSRIFTSVMLLLFVIMVLAVIISKASGGEPSFFGYQLKTVLSGSMEPTFMTGSIIAVDPNRDMTQLVENEIITFMDGDRRLITHRIIEVIRNEDNVFYRTKGDNNDGPDAGLVNSKNVTAVYTGFTLPYIGYMFNFASSKMGSVILLIIPGVLLFGYSIITTWRAISQLEVNDKDSKISSNPEQIL